jgi:hypothetical protein
MRPEQALAWMPDGTERLPGAVSVLGDGDLDEPSLLPGRSRRHLLADVAAGHGAPPASCAGQESPARG